MATHTNGATLGTFVMGFSTIDFVIYAFVCFVIYSVVSWYKLSHIPGSFFSAVSPLWLLATQLKGDAYITLKATNDKYGPIVRIGPNAILITDVKVAQRLGALKSPYRKGPWYGTFRFMKGQDHSFSILNEEKHATLRTKIGPGYAGSDMMEKSVDNQTSRLLALIETHFLSERMDMAAISHFYSMDVIGDMAFGKPFGFLDEGKDIFGYLKWNEGFLPIGMTAATFPWLAKMFQSWPFSEALPKATDKSGLGRFIGLAQKRVGERFRLGAQPQRDMMGLFLQQGVTRDEAIQEAILQVVAGTDSVATTLRMTLLYILTTPRVYVRLLKELDEALVQDRISQPIRDAEARKLPYLQAVIREGLRIFPGATPLLFKTAPPEGDEILGYKVPAGTQVGINGFAVLRSKKYWGEDADLFRPERWLIDDKTRLAEMVEIADVQFGFGRYKCLGRPLVFMQMNKFLPELLRRYDIAVMNPVSPVKIVNAGFWLMTGFWVVLTHREHI